MTELVIVGIGIATGMILFFTILALINEKPPKKDHFYKRLVHLVGHPYLLENDIVDFDIIDGKITIAKLNKKTYDVEYTEVILPSQVTQAEIKNEKEITSSVTLPRVIMLGVLSLAAKKQTTIDNYFFILSYNINNIEVNCLFKGAYETQSINDLSSVVTRLRIENQSVSV